MDQYMALSKKDLQINITMNEVYNTQSLLQQHIDSLVRYLVLYDVTLTTTDDSNDRLETINNIYEFSSTN
jgi:hypothetical protein